MENPKTNWMIWEYSIPISGNLQMGGFNQQQSGVYLQEWRLIGDLCMLS